MKRVGGGAGRAGRRCRGFLTDREQRKVLYCSVYSAAVCCAVLCAAVLQCAVQVCGASVLYVLGFPILATMMAVGALKVTVLTTVDT